MLLSASAFSAPAAKKQLTSTLTVWKIVTKNGKQTRVPTKQIAPGEVVEYQVQYRNNTKKALHKVLATLPIPKGLAYIPNTASPKKVQASVDGKVFATAPLRRKVTVNGKSKIEKVPYAQYRFLRWNLAEIKAGKTATVHARVRIAQ